jgi:hypothetical protein
MSQERRLRMHCELNRWLVVLSFCALACVGCAGDATDNARLDSLEGAVDAAELHEAIDPVVDVPDAEPSAPPSTLRHGAKIIGREGHWRPVKWSVAGDHVAIITRQRQAPASPGRVYYYNASTQALTLIAADAKANVPVPWNGLHYKAGGIGVNHSYIVYCAENGLQDSVRVRSLSNLNSYTDWSPPAVRSCSNVSQDARGDFFGVIWGWTEGLEQAGGTIWADVARFNPSTGEMHIVHESVKTDGGSEPNPYYYDRGPATSDWDGAIAWLLGGHEDHDTTALYYANGQTYDLPPVQSIAAGLKLPVQLSVSQDTVVIFHYSGRLARPEYAHLATGLSVWEPRTGALRHLGVGSAPSIVGQDVVFSRQSGPQAGIWKLNLSDPSGTPPTQLTQGGLSASGEALRHLWPRLGDTGWTVYLEANQSKGGWDGMGSVADLRIIQAFEDE